MGVVRNEATERPGVPPLGPDFLQTRHGYLRVSVHGVDIERRLEGQTIELQVMGDLARS